MSARIVCVCVTFFSSTDAWGSCNQTTLASGVSSKKFHVSPGRIGRARRCSRGLQSCAARVSGLSALHRAAQQGDAAEVQRLIESGADVEHEGFLRQGPWRLRRTWDEYPSAFPPWPLEKRVAEAGFTYNK